MPVKIIILDLRQWKRRKYIYNFPATTSYIFFIPYK